MTNKLVLMIFLMLSLFDLKGTNLNSKQKQDSIIEIDIEVQHPYIDNIVSELKTLSLPDLNVVYKNDSIVRITFVPIFKSKQLKNILRNASIYFLDTYEVEVLTKSSIFSVFRQYGINEIQSGNSHVGDFAISDTLLINNSLKKKDNIKGLPSDLIFAWCNTLKKDSIALFLINKNKTRNKLDEQNFTNLSIEKSVTNIAIEFDKNWKPTKWEKRANYIVNFKLDNYGTKQFYNLTKNNIGNRIAFSINNKIISVPQINSTIEKGEVTMSLTGKQDLKELFKELLFSRYNRQKVHIKGIEYKQTTT
ncbi:hypothetical protein Palpr_0310 [Paludibacter propionicigenes WB4]|uniref:SecDF P1 head subdomain domain-containing protein n=1 Tax=Paludibacter propionicigenes (strain DSM 17365 / JCM 13257 / WB4) TaxID=694427 RepID=E4T191_PALPW|nr:hypothetical protein [Paludibacter propionicigenes]ADQ78472.1 hypothetical protein Palpr_0310 [Paludibacter propionicigenes WB4]